MVEPLLLALLILFGVEDFLCLLELKLLTVELKEVSAAILEYFFLSWRSFLMVAIFCLGLLIET